MLNYKRLKATVCEIHVNLKHSLMFFLCIFKFTLKSLCGKLKEIKEEYSKRADAYDVQTKEWLSGVDPPHLLRSSFNSDPKKGRKLFQIKMTQHLIELKAFQKEKSRITKINLCTNYVHILNSKKLRLSYIFCCIEMLH